MGGDPDGVRFADMMQVGRNPGRIISAWRAFVAEQATSGRRFRGIGEPIWATRSASELVECARHEALLDLAFRGRVRVVARLSVRHAVAPALGDRGGGAQPPVGHA